MNIVFLTLNVIDDLSQSGIYTDLLRKFIKEGHNVHVISPAPRGVKLDKYYYTDSLGATIIRVKTLKNTECSIIEKGFSMLTISCLMKRTISRYISKISVDLIIYSTPPITFLSIVKYLKKKFPKAKSYLLLKDIVPDAVVDLQIFSKKSLLYKYYRAIEKELYKISDYIGCMSPANVRYCLEHNSYISSDRIELAPNSIELKEFEPVSYTEIRKKNDLPIDKPIFIYGGNLGKPQAIDFIIKVLEYNKSRDDRFFLIVGSGTEFLKLNNWFIHNRPSNAKLLDALPVVDYDNLLKVSDVGLIFLDHRYTIPNYPSRLLSYLSYKKPIIAATDINTDVGTIAETNGYGFSCDSVDPANFTACVDIFVENQSLAKSMGEKGYKYLCDNYLVENTYNAIIKHFDNN